MLFVGRSSKVAFLHYPNWMLFKKIVISYEVIRKYMYIITLLNRKTEEKDKKYETNKRKQLYLFDFISSTILTFLSSKI
jgi:hypothetical protein